MLESMRSRVAAYARRAACAIIAAALVLLSAHAVRAQNNICPTAALGDSSNRCASTAFVQGAIASPSTPATVPHGGTGQSSFTPNLPLIGNGTGPLAQGTRSGNTTSFGTTSGALTSNNCIKADSNGNLVDSGGTCGALPGVVPTSLGGTGANNSTNSSGDLLASNGPNGNFVATAFNALCSLVPSVCNKALGYTSITWYGAKCDGIFQSNQNFDQPATNLSITATQTLLTSSGSTFTSADVGKRIYVPGAGPAGAALSTTIASFVGATQVNLTVAASTTITTQAATNAAPFVYGTDDTAAIQAAYTGVPFGGTVVIPGSHTGCIIRQQGANSYALLQNKPFTVRGDGRYSNLMTFPDIPSTVDDMLVDGTAGYDWNGVSWTGFSIGMSPAYVPPTFITYRRYGKRGLVLLDSAAGNFVNFNVANLMIGESSNDHSLYIGNPTSSPSQGGNIIQNRIFGGVHLANVSDSFQVSRNWLYGTSTFGGLFEFVGGAAGFNMSNNNVTWTGCTIFEGGTKPTVTNNYFEEVVNASSCARNAMVDFNGGVGTVTMPTFTGNIVNADVSTTATPVRYSNVTAGNFGDNFVSTSTARTLVTSTTQLSCIAPNQWAGGGTHFSTALANTYAGC